MPLLANNATAQLAAAVTATDTTIWLQSGLGELFPNPVNDWFPVTLMKASGALEIVRCTARSGDALTVERAQEGTEAKAFSIGDRAELRLTAAVINAISLPVGTGPIPTTRLTEPDGWIFADGRLLTVATIYGALRKLYIDEGYPFGQDGNGNPYIPDCRGRVAAGSDAMGGVAAGRLTSIAASVGATGGAQSHVLTGGQMPWHGHGVTDPGHAHSVYDPGHAHVYQRWTAGGGNAPGGSTGTIGNVNTASTAAGTGIGIYAAGTGISIQGAGGNEAHNNVQPTLITNMIIKT